MSERPPEPKCNPDQPSNWAGIGDRSTLEQTSFESVLDLGRSKSPVDQCPNPGGDGVDEY